PTSQIDHVAYFKYGYIIFITYEPVPEAHDIFKRFAKVFQQTYTRFLDLQNAEAQNKIIHEDNERKSQELEEARELQLAMLPKELPQLPHLDIAVFMQTATEVGGDYYDFSTKENGSLNIAIGDATGHGMQAGTLVTLIKGLFTSEVNNKEILEFLQDVSGTIKEINLSRLMMAFSLLKIKGNRLQISSAGMPPMYIYRNNSISVEEIDMQGMPLGAIKNFEYKLFETELNTGDCILLLSDG
ncbi:MAG: SpoIIE family protein phosphatase, partial [Melioribacteraceae bacterium]|nr:SpoIIE family protein phosphatase [Melioribacteraceae bacterium]